MRTPSILMRYTLRGHRKAISTLSIDPDGRTLLSGDEDGQIILWNIDTGMKLQDIACPIHGPIITSLWIKAAQGAALALAFGCADGSAQVYSRSDDNSLYTLTCFKQGHDSPVEHMAFDDNHRRLATVARGGLQLWHVTDDWTLNEVDCPAAAIPYLAKSVQFCDNGNSVIVFYLESHEIIVYNVHPFKLKWKTRINTRIGYATFSADQRSLLISNLVNGVDSYMISSVSSSLQQTQTYRYPIRINVPLQVASALQGHWVISGSDDGLVRIFDHRTGDLIRTLRHGNAGTLVQTITAFSDGADCLIISGSSDDNPPEIKVWAYTAVPAQNYPESHHYPIWQICLVMIFVSIVVHLAVQHLPGVAKPATVWLIQALAVWCDVKDMVVDTVVENQVAN